MSSIDLWSGSLLAVVLVVAAVAVHDRRGGWGVARQAAFVAAMACAAIAVLPPVDDLADRGLLQAHIGQHILLGDLAAPLLLLGLPDLTRRRIAAFAGRSRRRSVLLGPRSAFAIWAAGTYFWLIAPIHRAAIPAGWVQLADHLSFLTLGGLIWLAAFDPRPTTTLRDGLRSGGMPWWARHIFAMTSRLALMPAAAIVWFAPATAYHLAESEWTFAQTQARDQIASGALMAGFEMILFASALTLALVFVQVSEGRRRARDGTAD